jgi:hypothetical protein
MIARVFFALALFFAAIVPASAQFADQATFAGTGAGTANAQTITVPNATSYADLYGVLIKFIPGATNSGSATLAVSGLGGALAGGPITIQKPTGSGRAALTGQEIVSGRPIIVMYDGTNFDIMAEVNLPVGAGSIGNSALSFGVPVNLQLNAAVSANALTINLCTINSGSNTCNAPTPSNPILIPFRDATIAWGDPNIVAVTSALSFTIGSGNTMGCVSGVMCRLWIISFNNAGTAALCAINARSGTNVAPINEAALQTSQSGTSGGNSAQLYYCDVTALTNQAIRILGYVEISETTAGTWATGPTYVQLFGPGIKKPGDIVQVVSANSAGAASAVIIPTSAANLVQVFTSLYVNTGTSAAIAAVCITRNSIIIGLCINAGNTISSFTTENSFSPIAFDAPGSTSATTYTLTTTTGSVQESTMIVNEIMSELESANDNGEPLKMVG